jgi:trimethylamine:corrinoid methyltransferase-like protein
VKQYTLGGGIEKHEIQQIHETALTILERAGLRVPSPRVLELLRGKKGLRVENSVVRMDRKAVSEILEEVIRHLRTQQPSGGGDKELICTVGGLCLSYMDLVDDTIRAPRTADLVDMVKLADAYGLSGVNPLTPADIPAPIKEITIHKLCLEHSRDIMCGIMNSPRQAQFIHEMNQVVGKTTSFSLWCISPLQLGNDSLEMLYSLRDKDNLKVRITNMPMLGATSPIGVGEALCQSMAELLGGLTVAYHVAGPQKIHFRIITLVYPFDMRLGTCLYGSPESNLLDILSMQISDFYGLPHCSVRGYKGMGKGHDPQSAAERAFGVLTAALCGWNEFFAVGRTSNDEVFSPIQLVIDLEILQYARRFMKGYSLGNISDVEPLLAKIADAREGSRTFLEQEETVKTDFAAAYWFPEVFNYERLQSWMATGMTTLVDKARAIATEKIRTHIYRREAEKLRALDEIYRAACAHLQEG